LDELAAHKAMDGRAKGYEKRGNMFQNTIWKKWVTKASPRGGDDRLGLCQTFKGVKFSGRTIQKSAGGLGNLNARIPGRCQV